MMLMSSGKYAYAGHGEKLIIYNISNPVNPEIIGSSETTSTVGDVVVSGEYLYVSSSHDGLFFINISNPELPVLEENALYVFTQPTSCFTLSGDYAYIETAIDGLSILDISNPTFLRRVNEEYMNDFYQYHDKTSQTEVFSTVISFFIKATVVGFVLYMAAKNAEKPSKTHNNQKKRDRHD